MELGEWADPALKDLRLTRQEELELFETYIPQFFEDGAPLSVSMSGAFRYDKGSDHWSIFYRRECPKDKEDETLSCPVPGEAFYIGADGMVAPCQGMCECAFSTHFPNQYIGMVPAFFSAAANYAVLSVGVWLTMQGRFSLGAVLMFQGFLGSFMSPAMTLVSAGQTIQEMRTQMERVEDVMEYPEDENVAGHAPEAEAAGFSKLRGNVELKNVTFGYSRLEEPLIKDFSLTLRTGQRVALVGASGCGKSTLVRLLLGFEKPEKGAVFYDGKNLESLDLPSLRRKIGTVTQDAGLFQGDIFSNIVISAPELTQQDAWEAAEAAGIADDIRAMPMGMNTIIAEGQGGISGGQRQRIMIARAIAPKPNLLIFDEATSALDNRTQKQVSEALDRMGCTRFVIAHRLSTIRHCDRILVLDGGTLIEDGTYEELIEKNGFFAELVERQRLDTGRA